MTFDPALNWFIAEGIPITPYDDAGKKNYYPLMKVTARDSTGASSPRRTSSCPSPTRWTAARCHASGFG